MANSLIMGFDGNSCFTGFFSTSQAYFNINQLGNSGAIYGSTGNENYCPNDERWSILSRSSENIGEIIDQNKEITKPTTDTKSFAVLGIE